MKRLTMRLDDGRAVMRCEECKEGRNGVAGEGCTAMYCRNMCKDRLAAYEDTGLEPEICAEYKKFEDEIVASGKTFNHLIELLRAEKEGRVKLVEEWAAAHPRKTRQSVFLEQYPNAVLDKDGVLRICPSFVGGDVPEKYRCICLTDCNACRREFWMQEVE